MDFKYYDFNQDKMSSNIEFIFPDWQHEKENVVVFSPHDDDGILGAGYIIKAVQENNANCYVFIFCDGACGYSNPEQKDEIVEIRREESYRAYEQIDIKPDNIHRFDYPDFSANSRISWKLPGGKKGNFEEILRKLREINATRVIIPNGYREHIDHKAVNTIGEFNAPQAGDPIAVDWGEPINLKSTLIYSVWGDFSPEDAVLNDRNNELRANCGLKVNKKVENNIIQAIKEYESQSSIISNLVQARQKRESGKDKFIEVYQKFEPRPELEFEPYLDKIKEIDR